MALPTFVAVGAEAHAAAAAITPALPAGIAVNDLLLLAIETSNQAVTIANAAGGTWTEVTDSPQGEPGNGALQATRLTVFWSRYNGTQTAPTTDAPAEHVYGYILGFTGVKTTGNPWNVTSGGVATNPSATVTVGVPGDTTTVADCLVVILIAHNVDATGGALSAFVNADLASIAERADGATTDGNGGGVACATGTKVTAGSYTTTTATISSAARSVGQISIALEPAAGAPAEDDDSLLLLGVS